MKKKVPLKTRNKEALVTDLKQKQKIERQKTLARLIFPFIIDQKTIYDAQTVISALSGFIKSGIANKMSQLSVKDIVIDLSNEKDSAIKTSLINVRGLLELENADEMASLLDRFSNGLGQFSSGEYMKNPMNIINIDNFIA